MLDIYIYFRAWIPYHYDTVLDLLNNWDDRGSVMLMLGVGRSGECQMRSPVGLVAGSLESGQVGSLESVGSVGSVILG